MSPVLRAAGPFARLPFQAVFAGWVPTLARKRAEGATDRRRQARFGCVAARFAHGAVYPIGAGYEAVVDGTVPARYPG